MNRQFARISTPPDGRKLILGVNSGLLKPGHVYEIAETLGELTIQDIGPSVAIENNERIWNHNASWIIEGQGRHLLVNSDYAIAPKEKEAGGT